MKLYKPLTFNDKMVTASMHWSVPHPDWLTSGPWRPPSSPLVGGWLALGRSFVEAAGWSEVLRPVTQEARAGEERTSSEVTGRQNTYQDLEEGRQDV